LFFQRTKLVKRIDNTTHNRDKKIIICIENTTLAKKHYLCDMVIHETDCQMSTNAALVSVVLCTYNGGRYLKDQIDSLIAQYYPLHEILIQDDGSTDDTVQIAAQYAAKYDNIHLSTNTHEHGINSNFFSALRQASGEFIAICDQDDIWEPDKISCQVQAIGDRLMCFCHSKPFSEDGSFAHYDKRMPNYSLYRLLFNNEIPGHTILMHRSLLNLLPEEGCEAMYQKRMYDIILALTAAAYDSIVFVDKPLVHHRRYEEAATYSSYSGSLPSAGNATHILKWSICHYHKMKKLTHERYTTQMTFLSQLRQPAPPCEESIRFMNLLISNRFIDFVRLIRMCVKHRFEIFHTRGKDPVNILRAMLFPFTSLYYCRFLLNLSDK